MIITTTSHWSREMAISGPTWNFGNGHETEPVNVKLTSEPPPFRKNETHLFPHASTFSLLEETLAFNLRLLYLDERPGPGAHRSGLVTDFYTARYIVGIL
jgi:hypothetical protein